MEKELIEYGLSQKEAKLYLLLLKSRETTANRLIELSGLARGTAYDILEKLKLRGLATSFIKDRTTYYSANDPEILVSSLKEKEANINKIIPNLKSIKKSIKDKPLIEFFEGFAGVKKVLDEVLYNCAEVIIMGNEQDAREIIKHHPENFRQRRLEKRIKIKNLLEESQIARELKDDKYSQVKYLSQLKDSKEVLIIYNDTTAHMLMSEPIVTIKITSKEYTNNQRLMFDNLWKLANK